ncbi:MAG: ZIP family metal transporter [Halothiobacillaceae bacterium]|nr:ZIP family metal transporter [Halothiobacillaceae bacterium]HER35361.1 ZIP family metal transporter [Halothiobacillaceae bacterium]
MPLEISLMTVFLAAMATALATGLGAIPLAYARRVDERWLAVGAAMAAGLMLAASHSLVAEGSAIGSWRTLAGMASGLAMVVIADRWLDRRHKADVSDLQGADAKKALMIVGVMTIHSFAEGVGVGVSYGGGEELGMFITAAIAVHNIPEGLAIALVLVPRGVPVWQAAGWAIFSSLPQPLMAIPAYLFVRTFEPFLPIGLGLAAGAMIWMVFAELLPDANRGLSTTRVGTVVALSFMAMFALQLVIAG